MCINNLIIGVMLWVWETWPAFILSKNSI
jgi:hypothetical protein